MAVILPRMFGSIGAASLRSGLKHADHANALPARTVTMDAWIIAKHEGVTARKNRMVRDNALATTVCRQDERELSFRAGGGLDLRQDGNS